MQNNRFSGPFNWKAGISYTFIESLETEGSFLRFKSDFFFNKDEISTALAIIQCQKVEYMGFTLRVHKLSSVIFQN